MLAAQCTGVSPCDSRNGRPRRRYSRWCPKRRLNEFWGPATPALALRPVEGRAVVMAITDPSAGSGDVSMGDVVLAVDGHAAESRLATFSRCSVQCVDAPCPSSRRREPAIARSRWQPRSHEAAEAGRDSKRDCPGAQAQSYSRVPGRQSLGHVVRVLAGNIGYIDLRVLQPHEVDSVFEQVKGTAAIIFDMRGYPNNTRSAIAAKLTDRARIEGATISIPIAFEPGPETVQSIRNIIELTPTSTPVPRQDGDADRRPGAKSNPKPQPRC